MLSLPVPEMRNVRGSRIGMIFQEPMTSLNPVTAVGHQVIEAILLHAKVSRAEARRRVLELFAHGWHSRPGHALSMHTRINSPVGSSNG